MSPVLDIARAAMAVAVFALHGTPSAVGADAPPIRTIAGNAVPACVTPAALDRFLFDQITQRGYRLLPQFHNIAEHYRRHGEAHRVRWDFAFFQMALETNFLSYRRGDGKRGDVVPEQNNFAGLGTTGVGVPGDRYPDVSTGVLAQIQHLVVYSGERLRAPVGHRTRLKQDDILRAVSRIARQRPVTFADLARRWAADRHYGRSIRHLADLFYAGGYCRRQIAPAATASRTHQPRSAASPGVSARHAAHLPPPPVVRPSRHAARPSLRPAPHRAARSAPLARRRSRTQPQHRRRFRSKPSARRSNSQHPPRRTRQPRQPGPVASRSRVMAVRGSYSSKPSPRTPSASPPPTSIQASKSPWPRTSSRPTPLVVGRSQPSTRAPPPWPMRTRSAVATTADRA